MKRATRWKYRRVCRWRVGRRVGRFERERQSAIVPDEPGLSATIKFSVPQRALASGQIMALYEGEKLMGGGVFV
jgi:tRNA U34 2-thiouridine synthase MnmA/TrmU